MLVRLTAGTILDDRYEIREYLDSGRTGSVYKAYDPTLSRDVAIKFIRLDLIHDEIFMTRFLRESRTLADVTHQNVVRCFDVRINPNVGAYQVSELVDGVSLASLMKAEALSWRHATELIMQVCEGSSALHAKGLVHRDIKPSNLMIDRSGTRDLLKIIDFGFVGIVSWEGQDSLRITNPEFLVGTPSYMSPEQCRGKELDQRSDLYAIGCVLYELIAGVPPFIGESPVDTMLLQMTRKPMTLTAEKPDEAGFPSELRDIVAKAIEKNPDNRFQSAQELRSELSKLLHSARPIESGKALSNFLSGGTQQPSTKTTQLRESLVKQSPVFLLSLLLVVALGTLVFKLRQSSDGHGKATAQAFLKEVEVDEMWSEELPDFKRPKGPRVKNAFDHVAEIPSQLEVEKFNRLMKRVRLSNVSAKKRWTTTLSYYSRLTNAGHSAAARELLIQDLTLNAHFGMELERVNLDLRENAFIEASEILLLCQDESIEQRLNYCKRVCELLEAFPSLIAGEGPKDFGVAERADLRANAARTILSCVVDLQTVDRLDESLALAGRMLPPVFDEKPDTIAFSSADTGQIVNGLCRLINSFASVNFSLAKRCLEKAEHLAQSKRATFSQLDLNIARISCFLHSNEIDKGIALYESSIKSADQSRTRRGWDAELYNLAGELYERKGLINKSIENYSKYLSCTEKNLERTPAIIKSRDVVRAKLMRVKLRGCQSKSREAT